MAACGNGEIGLWSITHGTALLSPPQPSEPQQDWQQAPFFGPGSTILFFSRRREPAALETWDWGAGKAVNQPYLGRLDAYGFSPDGALLACVFPGEGVVLMDAKKFRRLGATPFDGARIFNIAFSPSGQWIATVSADGTAKLWEVKTRREIATVGEARRVLFTPDA